MSTDWDPEIDTPATIAVIGGGPVGIEAALYARFLGYFVILFQRGRIGQQLLDWGEYTATVGANQMVSSLGLAALEAQGTECNLSRIAEAVTYKQYVEEYLVPVAKTDLLYESIHINAPVVSLGRHACAGGTEISNAIRAEREFRVHANSRQRGEFTQLADIVFDCSGVRTRRCGLASGGGLAVRERASGDGIANGKQDLRTKNRDRYAGKHTVLYGNNLEACANAVELEKVAAQDQGTRVTWIVPKHANAPSMVLDLPIQDARGNAIRSSPVDEVVSDATRILGGDSAHVVPIEAWGIEALTLSEARWDVKIQVDEDGTLDVSCDEVINCATLEPDWEFARSIPLASCAVREDTASSLLDGVPDPRTKEPHYYLFGQKSAGVNCLFTPADAFQQIRYAFSLIGGRRELDLYATVKPQGS